MTGITTALVLTLLFCFYPNCNCHEVDRLTTLLTCPKTMPQEIFDVYLLDLSNYKFVSEIPACVSGYNTKCIGSVKDRPDAESKFKMHLLPNGKVAFEASNGKYLSRIAYSNDPVDDYNRIQPTKDTPDHFSQFKIDYDEEGGPFENLGTITLVADNNRYVAPSGGTIIKPVAQQPHRFLLMPARSTARSQFMPLYYRWQKGYKEEDS